MAKRTYRDNNGYKRKIRKRGTPEFATIEEYQRYLAAKREEARSKHPNHKLRGNPIPDPVDPVVKLVEKMEEKLDEMGLKGLEEQEV